MSYPSNLTEKEMEEYVKKMKRIIPRGTIVMWDKKPHVLIREAEAHGGGTLLEVDKDYNVIRGSKKKCITLYMHTGDNFPSVLYTPERETTKEVKGYDNNKNLIYHKEKDGYEYWQKYDDNNNLIHKIDCYGSEEWYKYDKNDLIHHKNTDGFEEWHKYEYSEDHKIKYSTDQDNRKFYSEYDKNNNEICSIVPSGFEWWYEYDENNNNIYTLNSGGVEYWNIYDKNGHLICDGNSGDDSENYYKFDKKAGCNKTITKQEFKQLCKKYNYCKKI